MREGYQMSMTRLLDLAVGLLAAAIVAVIMSAFAVMMLALILNP